MPTHQHQEIGEERYRRAQARSRRLNRGTGAGPRQYTEEYRLEAAGHCRKAHGSDPKKSIRECAAEPGTSDKTLNEWILKQAKTGRVTQERTDGQKELDAAKKRIRELESGFLKEAAAFFARSL